MASKNNQSVLKKIIRFVTVKHPLLFFGVSGTIVLIFGIFMVIGTFNLASQTEMWSLETTLLSVAVLFSGIVLIIASLILYALSQLLEKLEKR